MKHFRRISIPAITITLLALLSGLVVLPLPVSAAGTIFNPHATDDSANSYYGMSYTGSFHNYRVYIDTDQSTATGYLVNGIGANYMVANNTLYSYSGTGSNWSWTSLGTVTYTNSNGAVDWTIARSAIGKVGNPNAETLVFGADNPTTWLPPFTHTYGATPTPTPTVTQTPGGPTNTPTWTNTPAPTPTSPPGYTTVTYNASTAVITNPERGWLHTYAPCETNLLSQTTLQGYRTNENISVILCNYYLGSFISSPIDQATLDRIQTQLNTVRSAGLKVVLRFAYSTRTSGPNIDADLPTILGHINQLVPIIQSNSDVILVWQAGFIGAWGEWYYTSHFGTKGTISTQQWADRKSVVDAMLAALPSTRMVSLRTPKFMRTLYGTTPVDASTAFNGSAVARIGQHNDAFVASPDDMGTYSTPQDPIEYPWLQAQTTYTPMGGENDAWAPPRTDCPTALQEMGLFHWSYINTDYLAQTISNWQSQGCYSTMQKNLGYRFVLTQGLYPNTVNVGGGLNVQISLRNDGYSAPFNPRGRELILRNTSNGTVYHFALTSDPRLWLAGTTTTINQTVTLTGVPAGNYALLLNLPDPVSGLSTRPEYSIQTANTGTWEASTGFNNLLHTVTVQ